MVSVYYRLPDQGEPIDKAFLLQLQEALGLQALILLRDFNHSDICCRDYTAGHKQPRRFLESINDNFLTQLIEEPMRRGMWLNLILTNKEGLTGDMKVIGSLGCPDHEIESRILRGESRSKSKITTLDFRRDFGVFRDLLEEVPWNNGSGGKRVQESWLLFKDHLLQAQERWSLDHQMTKKSAKNACMDEQGAPGKTQT